MSRNNNEFNFFSFISSISVCNRNDYDTVFKLQRTLNLHNAPIQRLNFAAFFVPVAFFPVYTPSGAPI